MSHAATQAGLSKAKRFLTKHPTLPECNVEIYYSANRADVQMHVHLRDADDLRRAHLALGDPEWVISPTETSATVTVDGVEVTIYFQQLVTQTGAQGALRQYGLVKGLVAL
jgi:hypothetical protein